MRQDGRLELSEALARLEPQLLDQHGPGVVVRLKRVCLAVAAVEGQHQLRVQALAEGVLRHQRLKLGDDRPMAALAEGLIDRELTRAHPELLEPADLGGGERLIGEVLKRRPAPERERLTRGAVPRRPRRLRRR